MREWLVKKLRMVSIQPYFVEHQLDLLITSKPVFDHASRFLSLIGIDLEAVRLRLDALKDILQEGGLLGWV